MKKNEKLRLEILGVTEKGFGVAKMHTGLTLFVDGALPGEVIDAHILKVKKHYGYAKIVEIVTPSPDRVAPLCPHAGRCGGCQFQHAAYSAQLRYKKEIVKNALQRIGGIENPPVADVIGMDTPLRYRNKAVFPVVPADNTDGFSIGMYAPRSHRIVPVADCVLQHEAHVEILKALSHFMRKFKVTAYCETEHTGIVRHIIVRNSLATGEVMAIVVAGAERIPHEQHLVDLLQVAGATSVVININTERTNTIMGGENRVLRGYKRITETLGRISYRLSAPSFFQVNPVQAAVLYETAIAAAGLTGEQVVIDAHCGVGGVALAAARHAAHVIGVDVVHASIYDAQKNAALNGITNTRFVCGTAEDVLPRVMGLHSVLPRDEVIFLDPPRKGCEPELVAALAAASPSRIIYISCDPATLARDIKKLAEAGYTLISCQPVDMFPMTGKVEVVVMLELGGQATAGDS